MGLPDGYLYLGLGGSPKAPGHERSLEAPGAYLPRRVFISWGCPEVAQHNFGGMIKARPAPLSFKLLNLFNKMVATGGLEPPTPAL